MTDLHGSLLPRATWASRGACRSYRYPANRLDRIQSGLSNIVGSKDVVADLVLLGMALSAVCVGCLVPNRWLPPLPNDKFLHFASFAVLAGLALRVADGQRESMFWLLGLLMLGWLIECLQGAFVPDRRFCWRDMAANAAGIAFAALAAQLYTSFF